MDFLSTSQAHHHSTASHVPKRLSFDDGATYWWEYPTSDCPYEDVNGTHNPGQPISTYIADCLNTPGCFGFNTNGVLKNGSTHIHISMCHVRFQLYSHLILMALVF